MTRVIIRQIGEAPPVDSPSIRGYSSSGSVQTRAVVVKPGRPILLWIHDLGPGASLSLDQPEQDHCLYVREGSVVVNETTADKDSMIAVEHLGRGTLRGGSGGASLLHFHRPDGYAPKPGRAGGHVHVVGKDGIAIANFPGSVSTLMAGGDCPTCELWMHKGEVPEPFEQALHYHTCDEIIVVTGGEMLIGNRALPPGTVMAVDANTRYAFNGGKNGMAMINFRPQGSYMFRAGPGFEGQAGIDERNLWRSSGAAR